MILIVSRDIRAGLALVGRLREAQAGAPWCKICAGATQIFDFVDANKCCSFSGGYEFGLSGVGVVYVRCIGCGFVFTADFDAWSTEDFRTTIYNDDYVRVDPDYVAERPAASARQMGERLAAFRDLHLLDYGSGAGAFVRAMREAGFRAAFGYDPFSSPDRPDGVFDVITCIEVIEHVPDPVAALRDMASLLRQGGVIFLQTSIQPADIGRLRGQWWYIAPRNGHISILGLKSLATAGRKAGLTLRIGAGEALLLHHEGAAPDPGLLAALGGGCARRYVGRRLGAPADDAEGWHGLERAADGGLFRWTGAGSLVWTMDVGGEPAYLDVRADFLMGATPEHLAHLELEVGGQTVPMRDEGGGCFTARVAVDCGPGEVRCGLRTLPPVSPVSLGRNSDSRELGIAVRV